MNADALALERADIASPVAASLIAELGPDVGELKRMHVAQDVRGLGIGRALLAHLEHGARTPGLARLVLETGTRQGEAPALYRSAGFTDIPAYGEHVASPGTSVRLAKALSSPSAPS